MARYQVFTRRFVWHPQRHRRTSRSPSSKILRKPLQPRYHSPCCFPRHPSDFSLRLVFGYCSVALLRDLVAFAMAPLQVFDPRAKDVSKPALPSFSSWDPSATIDE
ncbi:hypothetical protein ACHAXS_013469 [Conticribra weissflogii]